MPEGTGRNTDVRRMPEGTGRNTDVGRMRWSPEILA
jgi:hypothetical protein